MWRSRSGGMCNALAQNLQAMTSISNQMTHQEGYEDGERAEDKRGKEHGDGAKCIEAAAVAAGKMRGQGTLKRLSKVGGDDVDREREVREESGRARGWLRGQEKSEQREGLAGGHRRLGHTQRRKRRVKRQKKAGR